MDNDFDVMNDLAIQFGGSVDLLEAVAGDDLVVTIDEFDPSSDIEKLMIGLDSMIPQDAPYVEDEEDFE